MDAASVTALPEVVLAWVDASEVSTQEWHGLIERDPDASLFQTPDWIEPWWEHLGEGRLRLLTARRAGRLIALAPLVERRETVNGVPARVLAFAGEPLADRLGVVCDESEPAAGRAATERIAREARRLDLIRLSEVPEESATARWLRGVAVSGTVSTTHRLCSSAPVRPLAGSFESIEAGYGKSLRTRLRRARAKQAGAGGATFRRWTPKPEELGELLATFKRIEDRSWKGRRSTGVFSDSSRARFMAAVAERLARRTWLDVATIHIKGRLAAYRLGFRFRGAFLDYNLAHDPEFADFSPGRVLLDLIIRDSHAIGLRAVDASRGRLDVPHLLAEWSDQRRLHGRWLLFGTSCRARSLWFLERRIKPLWRWARDGPGDRAQDSHQGTRGGEALGGREITDQMGKERR